MRFTTEKLSRRIEEVGGLVFRERLPLDTWSTMPEAEATGRPPAPDDPRWQPFALGGQWGADDAQTWAWFRRQVVVPEGWEGRRIAVILRIGEENRPRYPEALAFVNGVVHQGLDRHHDLILLSESAQPGTSYDLALEAWRGQGAMAERFHLADLVWLDQRALAFYWDAKVALDLAATLSEDDYARIHLINSLDEAFLRVDFREPIGEEFYSSLEQARLKFLELRDALSLPPRHERVRAVGHAHIDVAWLWPLAQTRQKAARTFSSALRLMERYPHYHFMASQAQLYRFIQEDYPQILEEIRQRAAEGRLEVNGITWVEMDTNIPSGESLVRQFLYGRRFFEGVFGQAGSILWLPDAFGYSGALPQIIRRVGGSYFMTTKISWNQYNRFPYDTFYWKGIDGTEVLAHFCTTPSNSWFYTYNGQLTPVQVRGTWQENRSKEITDEVLMTYGYGDGGGGPTSEMLEVGERLANYPGSPRVVLGTAEGFFRELEERLQGKHVPEWEGEMYLEYHRGTLTSQARNKRANRKAEVLLHRAEALAAAAALLGGTYPAEDLREAWELVLLNQFHDIIPGSSIRQVYEDSARDYAAVRESGNRVCEQALRVILPRLPRPEGDGVAVLNITGRERTDLVALEPPSADLRPVDMESGEALPTQVVRGEDGREKILALAQDIPSYGYRTYVWARSAPEPRQAAAVRAGDRYLETPFLRLTLDDNGHIASLYDKRAQREVLAEGEVGNVLQAFEDKPLANDAWDIDIFYQDKMWPLDEASYIRVIEEGPLRAGLEIRRAFRHSLLVQRIYGYAHTPRLDFETEVDWHEHHTLLKVAFPVAVHSPRATYEIQFGAVERPTHWNTSWDYARFEVCGHRWADLSEGDYGVSILNDCKYGHDIKGHVMRLTLIKCATHPDPEADQGLHRFTYSLLPHPGDWRQGTVHEGAALNEPFMVATLPAASDADLEAFAPVGSLVRCSAEHVVLDTVKGAEDGEGLIIRLYEAYGQRGPVTLTFAREMNGVWECDLMERNEAEVEAQGTAFSLAIKPFQIRTFRVTFRG